MQIFVLFFVTQVLPSSGLVWHYPNSVEHIAKMVPLDGRTYVARQLLIVIFITKIPMVLSIYSIKLCEKMLTVRAYQKGQLNTLSLFCPAS